MRCLILLIVAFHSFSMFTIFLNAIANLCMILFYLRQLLSMTQYILNNSHFLFLHKFNLRWLRNSFLWHAVADICCWRQQNFIFHYFHNLPLSQKLDPRLLSLNLSKTNYILFRNRSADTDLNICINTINVTRVQSSKFPGIIIDENLNWKPHIQLVKSKLSKTLSIIYKASKLINYEGMVTLYCSLFLPYLTYCCEIWGNTYATNVNCM